MQTQDLKQISNLLDQKLKENNKEIEKMTDNKINEFAIITHEGFMEQNKLFNKKIDGVKTELKQGISDAKTELIESNEKIAKELKDNREEQAAIVGGHQRIDDTLLNHGDRISNLEIITKIKQKEIAV